MRLGLLVRGDDRGLGVQTWEIYRHLDPAVTVAIDMSPIANHVDRWPQHFDRYPDAIVSPWGGYLTSLIPEAIEALMTVDVILTCETWYQPDIPELAKEKGIATVIMVNPELWREHETKDASATWIPTKWRQDYIPKAEVVNMPVALDRLPFNPGPDYLHLGGHKARMDRNGMEISIRSARYAGIPLTVTTQDKDLRLTASGIVPGIAKANYWDMYDGFGVLVMPRKYGGLSLGVQEAMAKGLAVIMSDTSPNQDWPVARVPGVRASRIQMPGGKIDIFETDRTLLAQEMTRMLDLDYRAEFQAKGREWAEAHSWGVLKAEWLARLAELC